MSFESNIIFPNLDLAPIKDTLMEIRVESTSTFCRNPNSEIDIHSSLSSQTTFTRHENQNLKSKLRNLS
ncbi:hypothetical protein L211DRAFT_834996 [Terfezia boudieri ATCC MYA-4762]|uniref:Uncharacterized protein n=1 Tax=Terfezia boudieri ATCC MYA-4762 TaxID=1051890 RepID=A0A3N4M148_9PEZI|nr:hypothetical protein L211DRAFT_834996 [Terfezia boudieri ATCC MYA-4762]